MQTFTQIPVVAALITATAAFVGVMLAQVISHWFTVRREDRKAHREVHEKFFAPIIYDIFLFLEASTHYRFAATVVRGSPERLRNNVISHVGTHLSFASPRLISAYYELKRGAYIRDDMSDDRDARILISFFYTIVDEVARTARLIGNLEDRQLDEVLYFRNLFHIWQICARFHCVAAGNALLKHHWLFDKKKMGRRFRRRLRAWEYRSSGKGENPSDLGEQFVSYVMGFLAYDESAFMTLRDAVARAGVAIKPVV
jgi:hypothetical protein